MSPCNVVFGSWLGEPGVCNHLGSFITCKRYYAFVYIYIYTEGVVMGAEFFQIPGG